MVASGIVLDPIDVENIYAPAHTVGSDAYTFVAATNPGGLIYPGMPRSKNNRPFAVFSANK